MTNNEFDLLKPYLMNAEYITLINYDGESLEMYLLDTLELEVYTSYGKVTKHYDRYDSNDITIYKKINNWKLDL